LITQLHNSYNIDWYYRNKINGTLARVLLVVYLFTAACRIVYYIIRPYQSVAGFGMLGTCVVTFVLMFLPKSRQMTAMGREGFFLEVSSY
jgi:hypothetical protein